ncbi:MAG: hypothetical protein U1E87_03940 [Alphaproteobacteria bacterium]
MRRAFGWVVAAMSILALARADPAPELPAATPSYAALFDEVWNTVEENFYDPTFHGHDWRAIGDNYRPKVAPVRDDAAFSRLANAMLDELGVSHLFLNPPARVREESGVGIRRRSK